MASTNEVVVKIQIPLSKILKNNSNMSMTTSFCFGLFYSIDSLKTKLTKKFLFVNAFLYNLTNYLRYDIVELHLLLFFKICGKNNIR